MFVFLDISIIVDLDTKYSRNIYDERRVIPWITHVCLMSVHKDYVHIL